jgi:hypothetical protein
MEEEKAQDSDEYASDFRGFSDAMEEEDVQATMEENAQEAMETDFEGFSPPPTAYKGKGKARQD